MPLRHNFENNQAMQFASFLAQEHGFEANQKSPVVMEKVLDDQHAIRVVSTSLVLKRSKPKDVLERAAFGFHFCRRDINEYHNQWTGNHSSIWFKQPTVNALGKEAGSLNLMWAKDESFESIIDEAERRLLNAIQLFTLERVESELYDPSVTVRYVHKIVVNDALNGVDRVWDEYLEYYEKSMSTGGHPWIEAFDTKLREFKAEHPDGIPR